MWFYLIQYKNNIKIGKKDASDEEIIKAAKVARCYEFINKLPDGIETIIGAVMDKNFQEVNVKEYLLHVQYLRMPQSF